LRAYPITQGELFGLGGIGVGTALAFSAASGLFGFYMNTALALDLTQGGVPEKLAYWEAIKSVAFIASIVAAVIGIIFIGFGAYKVREIINTTDFDEG
jgi:hypothetical protein